MSSRELRFVHHADPSDTSLRKRQKRVAHSNAARRAHAEARRLRMIRYQASKAQERSQQPVVKAETNAVTVPKIVRLLSADRKDPFTSFVRPFKPIEHFLLDYCTLIRTSEPSPSLMRYRHHSRRSNDALQRARGVLRRNAMTRAWVPLALTDAGFLDSLFLMACRHLSGNYRQQQQQQEHRFSELSIQYKLDCVRSLREAISGQRVL